MKFFHKNFGQSLDHFFKHKIAERCKNCTISSRVSYVEITNGICNLCREHEKNSKNEEEVFKAKRVPLNLLFTIEESRDLHEQGYDSLKNSVPDSEAIEPFGFYFDYVVRLVSKLN